MSKKNSNVLIHKSIFKKDKKIQIVYEAFKKNIKNLKKGNFVIGVSGGADSLALAALVNNLRYEKKIKIHFVLVDHGVRKNSYIEALGVKKLLKTNKIFLKILRNKEKIEKNVQGKAREVRYKLLLYFTKKNKAKYILTGHHSDDQIETFLIRLSRGSGVQGLASMRVITKLDNGIHLVRPLLDTKKTDLIYCAKKIFGKIFKDPSNKNSKYLRTRVRLLKNTFEKAGIHHDQIIRSIKNLESTSNTLNDYVKKISKSNIQATKNKILINFKNISEESLEIQIRIISQTLKNFTKDYYPPRSKKVLALINAINSKKQKKFTLGGCIIEKLGNLLSIKKEA